MEKMKNMDTLQNKWIIWGTGKKGQELYDYLLERDDLINVIEVVDSDENKWGTIWNGYVIKRPEIIKETTFDKLIIAMALWRQVYRFVMQHYGIPPEKIENHHFQQREDLLNFYNNRENSIEIERQIDYIRRVPLDIFNDSFPEKYLEINFEIYLDESAQMYYVN